MIGHLANASDDIDRRTSRAICDAVGERLQHGLPPEARHELLAVLWIGRGDFAPREWEEALDEAQGRSTDDDVDYIAERGPLHDYLAKGLYLLKRP